jgi:hypothetical protein
MCGQGLLGVRLLGGGGGGQGSVFAQAPRGAFDVEHDGGQLRARMSTMLHESLLLEQLVPVETGGSPSVSNVPGKYI